MDELEKLIGDAKSLQNDINIYTNLIKQAMSYKIWKFIKNNALVFLNKASKWDNVLGDFAKNYIDMVEADTHGADKYFHAKANAEASKRGSLGEIVAIAISDFREIEEGIVEYLKDGKKIEDIIADAKEDQKSNELGRKLGRESPDKDVKDLLRHIRPNELDEKY